MVHAVYARRGEHELKQGRVEDVSDFLSTVSE